jgi:putative transposase
MRKVCGDFDAESREFNGEDDRVNWPIMHGHFWSPSYFAASCGRSAEHHPETHRPAKTPG